MKHINAKTRTCALIGNPVDHSFSPLVHNAGFGELGINFVYVAFQVKDKYLENAIKGIRALNIRGASITIPYKVRAIEYVDEIDPVAQKIGSINTIVNQNGRLKGFNSDGMGALKAFHDRKIDLNGKSIFVLGSGGVARAIAFALVMSNQLKELYIVGIIREEINILVNDLKGVTEANIQGEVIAEEILRKKIPRADILINCTPIGMYPEIDKCPVPADFLRKGLLVFDVVYNPPKTRLLKSAERIGCETISGTEMFINQAVVQFEHWTGEKAPETVMRKVVLDHLT